MRLQSPTDANPGRAAMNTTVAAHRAQERWFLGRGLALGADAAGAPASNLALFGAISGLYRDVDLGQQTVRIGKTHVDVGGRALDQDDPKTASAGRVLVPTFRACPSRWWRPGWVMPTCHSPFGPMYTHSPKQESIRSAIIIAIAARWTRRHPATYARRCRAWCARWRAASAPAPS